MSFCCCHDEQPVAGARSKMPPIRYGRLLESKSGMVNQQPSNARQESTFLVVELDLDGGGGNPAPMSPRSTVSTHAIKRRLHETRVVPMACLPMASPSHTAQPCRSLCKLPVSERKFAAHVQISSTGDPLGQFCLSDVCVHECPERW